ncbi:hypothetical protein ACPB9J_16150 [Streptomyces lavendulocolor]|uniref:hypothetical protein n=1 Tax=Streptomyces lavendulocolor TaxID=67316 RepID=UPI003C2CD913
MSDPRDLDRLARAVKTRRLELYPSRLLAAKSAGVSKDTWAKVEEGRPVRDVSYGKVDLALGWAVGSCLLIAEGGDPIPVRHVETEAGVHAVANIPQKLLPADVRHIVSDSVMATAPGLSGGKIKKISDQVIEELRKRGILPDAP